MKRLLLFVLLAPCVVQAQQWDNYRPDNRNVKLEETNLPIVFIQVDGQMIQREDRITATMKIIDNGAGQVNYADTMAHPGQHIDYEGYVGLRYRGNSSFTNSDKKPYSFRTMDKPIEEGGKKVKVQILGMGKDNNWALLAPYSDRSMMRDVLAFELSRPWMEFTPHTRFCEVLLDGIYYGVYIMTEVVSKGKQRLNLDDPGSEGDKLTGGYLLEVDRNDEPVYVSKYHPQSNDGYSLSWLDINIQYKEPDYEEITDVQKSYIQSCINAMEDALASSQYKDPEKGYRSQIDVTSFIDYQLSQEFGHNVDGYRLSGKFYKRRDSVDPRFKTALWDMNLAYGNSDYYDGWRTDTWIYQGNNILWFSGDTQLVPFWWARLNSDPAYVAELRARWNEYRHGNFDEERLMALVDSLADELQSGGAVNRNSKAWPRWGRYVWPNYHVSTSFGDELNFLKGWLKARLAWMDEQLEYDPTTAVETVTSSKEKQVSGYFTVEGKRLDHLLRRGIYIVRYSDGTTEKRVK